MLKKGLVISLLAVFVAVLFAFDKAEALEYGDIVLNSKKESFEEAGVKPVVFPHWFHRIRFKCKVCHEEIFVLKAGANDIDMMKIMNGEFCGKCHNGIVAWEPIYCDRCHSYEGE